VPTVVGVIADKRLGPANELFLTLEDGREVTIPADAERLKGGGVEDPGRLLLADPGAEHPWSITLPPKLAWPTHIDRCFVLYTGYAEERNAAIVTREGLVFEKAPAYDGGPKAADGRYDDPRGTSFCLDAEGRALTAS